jgi:5'-3' exonuclease
MNRDELLKLLNSTNELEEQTDEQPNVHERVMLIDGLNLFFRNFSAINYLNKDLAHIGGLGGFIRSLNTLINTIKPTAVYVIFDGIGSSVNRKNLLPEYKSGRNVSRITNWEVFENLEEENDAKVNQLVRLIHYLKCLPVKTISLDKVEADDVIAYLSNMLSNTYDSKVFIVSNDNDFVQCITDKVTLYRPTEREYYFKKSVKDKFGVLVENFILYKILMGDNSDKVEGIKGLGVKGLLKKFPELAERPVTFDELIEISSQKHKEHIVYSRVVFDEKRLAVNYRIMNLGNPIMDDIEKEYLNEVVLEDFPSLDIDKFIKFYNEDGLGKLITNPEYTIKDTYKVLNSFTKK